MEVSLPHWSKAQDGISVSPVPKSISARESQLQKQQEPRLVTLFALKLICKTSLKANQLIDLGDIEGYQKIAKVYDSLMKSGKFTAAQNKAEQGEYVDSISEFVALCEKDGFIPRYYVDGPQDKVDRVIEDMKFYLVGHLHSSEE